MADDGVAEDRFGFSICTQENLAIFGASRGGGTGGENGPGCAYVFARASPGQEWTQVGKIIPLDGVLLDKFGATCALEGDTLMIGSNERDNRRGAVYVFTNPSGDSVTWEEGQVLQAPEGDHVNRFGDCIAIFGDTAVVGQGWYRTDNLPSVRGGAAYVFTRSGSTWSQQAKLEPSDRGRNFGLAVAIEGNTIAVSSAGRSRKRLNIRGGTVLYTIGYVAIFKRAEETWIEDQVIKPRGLFVLFGGAFGSRTLALKDNTLAIGAPDTKLGTFRSWRQGALYIYKRDSASSPFVQESRILTSDGSGAPFFGLVPGGQGLSDNFPQSVDYDDDGKTLCASTEYTNTANSINEGTAYIFVDK